MHRGISLVLVVASGVAGCGAEKSGSDGMVRTAKVEPEQAADGRLASNPAPLTIEDVHRQPKGSAQAAVVRMLFWAQWGNLPGVVNAYDPQVTGSLGVSKITATYAWLRPQIAASRFRIISARRSGRDVFVGVEAATTSGPPTRESFVLRHFDGGWRVVYDTLFERGLNGYTVYLAAPNATRVNPTAVKAGEAAAQRYRDIYPSLVLQAKEKAAEARRRAAATTTATPSAPPAAQPTG